MSEVKQENAGFPSLTKAIDELLADCSKLWREFDPQKPSAKMDSVKIKLGLLITGKYLVRLRMDEDVRAAAANQKLIVQSQAQIDVLRAQLVEKGKGEGIESQTH